MRIFLFIFLLFVLSACTKEYTDHIKREHSLISSRSGWTLDLSGTISSLPDIQVLESLISAIDQAKTRIWIETYTWTEKWTLAAVIRAKERWVDVKVVLEWSVYRTPWINNETVKQLKSSHVGFSYADNHRYTFTHIKTWIIDDRWCISTGNWSYTSFTKNREFMYCSYDSSILHDIEEIIQSDMKHVRPYFPEGLDTRIGLSPENLRPWITSRIMNANTEIIVYNQTITDSEILSRLKEKADKWIKIHLCQSYHEDEDSQTWIVLPIKNIEMLVSKKPYLHAKVFLIDGERVIIWSANMTENALNNNREILIDLGKNKKLYDAIFSFYHKDCHSSSGK